VLQFSPAAWAKLLYLRDYGETEVGGFGVTPDDDLMYVEDICLVRQTCSWAHVTFDDDSVANFFDMQVDAGRQPAQFARIWLHTHPGGSARPSSTDEETFDRAFGHSDWALMFILACEGQSYARLRFNTGARNTGPRADLKIRVEIDYSRPFAACDLKSWENEYLDNVYPQQFRQVANDEPLEELPIEPWRERWPEYADPGNFLLEDEL